MSQTEGEQRIAFVDLNEPWHLIGRIVSTRSRQTYYQYGAGRQRALIVLHGLRRNQVLHQRVRVRVEDDEWGPVVHVLGIVEVPVGHQESVYLVSAVIRDAYARRGGSRRGRPHRRTSPG